MEVKDFKRIRVGSGFPACFDVSLIDGHESYGVYAEIYSTKDRRIELRKNSYGEIALFNFKYDDLKLPESWENSEILWSNRSNNDV